MGFSMTLGHFQKYKPLKYLHMPEFKINCYMYLSQKKKKKKKKWNHIWFGFLKQHSILNVAHIWLKTMICERSAKDWSLIVFIDYYWQCLIYFHKCSLPHFYSESQKDFKHMVLVLSCWIKNFLSKENSLPPLPYLPTFTPTEKISRTPRPL